VSLQATHFFVGMRGSVVHFSRARTNATLFQNELKETPHIVVATRANEACARASVACDCGGKSDECYFDAELYDRTGHGGHCNNCRDDAFGVHCESCRQSFYKDVQTDRCLHCACHPQGRPAGRPPEVFPHVSSLNFKLERHSVERT